MNTSLPPGTTIGRYRVVSRLGAGGMGEVYLAEDGRLGRKVALKMLAGGLEGDPTWFDRLEQEARAASALNHPSILTVYDIGEANGRPFIATEFVDGKTLRQRMAEGAMSAAEVVRIGRAVAEALAAAHAAGVIHRDIKPENIMLRHDGLVKLLDFGIAVTAALSSGRTSLTATRPGEHSGLAAGTLRYMSAEQARGEHVDARSDVYSLGVVLFELLAGRPPFDAQGAAALLLSIVADPAPSVSQFRSDVPVPLEGMIRRALAKDRDERWPAMEELAAQLRALQESLERSSATGTVVIETRDAGVPGAPVGGSPLPRPPEPLIGREEELEAIERLLAGGRSRLVVLTGAGGTGKTHLAMEAASRLAGHYRDGVVLVPLAQVRDPGQIALAIAQALALKENPGVPLERVLIHHLEDRRVLLVLDNFEQLLPAAGLVADLLAGCPSLHALVTSRAALRIRGERELPVLPLPLPDLSGRPSVETVARVASVRLFVERAGAARPDFAVTPENAPAVAEICVRLDGLPLALELAAARLSLLSPQELLGRLARRLPLLTGGARDLPARHQTLKDTIAWSYQLLEPSEQVLFARLSVFTGGFALDAAEAVCGDDTGDVLSGMASLVANSLLRRRETPDGTVRISMLETIREFAADRLGEAPDAAAVRAAHARVFLAFAERADAELVTTERAAWLDRLEADHDNLQAAIDWAVREGEAETALRFASALWRFWEARGFLASASDRLEQILVLPCPVELQKARLKALYAAGVIADAAGQPARARARFEECLRLYRQWDDRWGVANALNNLGIVALRQSDHVGARDLFEESLSLWRDLGNRQAVALALGNLGNVAHLRGDYAGARDYQTQSRELLNELGDPHGAAWALTRLADLARDEQQDATAKALYEQAFGEFRRLGQAAGCASCLIDLGGLARDRGDAAAARAMLEEALVICGEQGDERRIALVLEHLALLADRQGRPDRAFTLVGAAEGLRGRIGAPRSPRERTALEARLGPLDERACPADRRASLAAGRALPVTGAIEFALAEPP